MNQKQANEYAAMLSEIALNIRVKNLARGIKINKFPQTTLREWQEVGIEGKRSFGVTGNPKT